MSGEDITRILTRLPPSGNASAVLTQGKIFVLVMTMTHIELRKLFAPNKSQVMTESRTTFTMVGQAIST